MSSNSSNALWCEAYKSKAHDTLLSELGVENQIHERSYRNKPLRQGQKQANTWRSQVRNRVESELEKRIKRIELEKEILKKATALLMSDALNDSD